MDFVGFLKGLVVLQARLPYLKLTQESLPALGILRKESKKQPFERYDVNLKAHI